MQLLVVSNLIKSCSCFDDSFSSVVRCSSAVRRNLIHGSSGSHGSVLSVCQLWFICNSWFMQSFGSPCRLVAGSVGSVIHSVRSVYRFTVADQYSPAQPTKHFSRLLGFFTNG